MKRVLSVLVFALLLTLLMPRLLLHADATQEEGGTTAFVAQELKADKSEYIYFESIEAAGEYLREGFVNRSFTRTDDSTVQVKISVPYDPETYESCFDEIDKIVDAHTGNPKGGDFFAFNTVGTSRSYDHDESFIYMTLNYSYMFTHSQSSELDLAVDQLLDELNVYHASDYEKVHAIYDWICTHVKYDYTETYYDTYSALCRREAVCQGYATLFYRLCLELDIDCRVVAGYTGIISHAWNIVCVEGKYYYVDATWGATSESLSSIDYYYFLKGINGINDHWPVLDKIIDKAMGISYSISEKDYPVPELSNILCYGQCTDTISFEFTEGGKLYIRGTGALDVPQSQWHFEKGKHVVGARDVIIEEGITALGDMVLPLGNYVYVSLPDSLVSIGAKNLFLQTSRLDLPKNLVYIEPSNLVSSLPIRIHIDPDNPYYKTVDGSLFSKDGKTLIRNGGVDQHYYVPDGVETIGPYAFSDNDHLMKVTLSDTVKYIQHHAFSGIGYDEEEGQEETLVELTDYVVSVEDYAFGGNTLYSVYIGKNLSHIGEGAFNSYTISQISVHPENQHYVAVDNVLFTKDMQKLLRYAPNRKDTHYKVPDGVVEIAAFAFDGYECDRIKCANLETVDFPDSLIRIGEYAFSGQELYALELPESLQVVGTHALADVQVDSIIIPIGVHTIEEGAFARHTAESITIKGNLDLLGYAAFLRRDYAEQNGNQPINIYFERRPPKKVETAQISQTIFGYPTNPDVFNDAHPPSDYPSIHVHIIHANVWDPDGSGYWEVDTADPQHKYPLIPYHKGSDGSIHEYTMSSSDISCHEAGSVTYSCTKCEDTVRYEILPKHTYQQTHVAPTCYAGGSIQFTCTRCGDAYSVPTSEPALGHDFFDGYCTRCGELDPSYSGQLTTFTANGHYYSVFSGEVTWGEAKVLCENMGGHLLTITGWQEEQTVYNLLGWDLSFWMGAIMDSSGQWTWISGEPWTYSNWNFYYWSGNGQTVSTFSRDGWHDEYDTAKAGYICEWDSMEQLPEDLRKYYISLCPFNTQGNRSHMYSHAFDNRCDKCGLTRVVDMTRPMVDMFRMYDPNSGEHFYTGSEEEKNNLIAAGWNYEGVGFTFPLTTGDPVHRLYDPVYGEHLYTMDVEEMNELLAAGWNYEGIAFNSGFENEVPQYRLHNPNATRGAYHFTASLEERDFLISLGWEYQGIGWYSLGA